MSSITPHPKLGVNPHLCYCPRCGGDSPELMLIGNKTKIEKCRACGATVYGGVSHMQGCPSCHAHQGGDYVGEIKEHDKLPGSLCDACKKEVEEHAAIVAAGGVYVKCKTCNMRGVAIPESQIAINTRETSKIAAPDPVGFAFNQCSEHTPNE